jgi:endonuclease YncB( thermonuclease family)
MHQKPITMAIVNHHGGNRQKKELHSLLPQGTTIVIQTDKEEKDNYGRLLAYIMKDNQHK